MSDFCKMLYLRPNSILSALYLFLMRSNQNCSPLLRNEWILVLKNTICQKDMYDKVEISNSSCVNKVSVRCLRQCMRANLHVMNI